jgi:hypothetical protein
MAKPRPYTVHYPGNGLGHCTTLANAITRGTQALLASKYDGKRNVQVNILLEGDWQADILRSPQGVVIRYPRRVWQHKEAT